MLTGFAANGLNCNVVPPLFLLNLLNVLDLLWSSDEAQRQILRMEAVVGLQAHIHTLTHTHMLVAHYICANSSVENGQCDSCRHVYFPFQNMAVSHEPFSTTCQYPTEPLAHFLRLLPLTHNKAAPHTGVQGKRPMSTAEHVLGYVLA